jgi:hypothetical protein
LVFPNGAEQDMDHWREELAALKATLAVQQVALRALAHSHPHPATVLEHWNRLRADCVAAAYAPGSPEDGTGWLTEQVHARAEAWTAELAGVAGRTVAT